MKRFAKLILIFLIFAFIAAFHQAKAQYKIVKTCYGTQNSNTYIALKADHDYYVLKVFGFIPSNSKVYSVWAFRGGGYGQLYYANAGIRYQVDVYMYSSFELKYPPGEFGAVMACRDVAQRD